MADKKITALTDLGSGIASADLLHIVDDPTVHQSIRKYQLRMYLTTFLLSLQLIAQNH